MRAPCKIDGCEQESRGRGWCSKHWSRWKNNGDPLKVKKSGVDFNVKSMCSVEGCGRPNHAHLFCNMHLSRYYKHGDPTVVLPITGRPTLGDVPQFDAIHKRLSRARGSASKYPCVDCGKDAQEWSYNQSDPAELYQAFGAAQVPYSLDINNYDPRCISCHRKFDGTGRNRPRGSDGRFLPGADITVKVIDDVVEVAA